ncbi:MAG: DUF1294 domain-containing protein [Oscillospiraceae bacterium]|nr:DUF1294 domain-containing protein [Oscillospiraceae bacterium]
MILNYFDYYLIAINIIGFVLFVINTLLYTYTADKQVDNILTIVSIIGGSAGILLAIILIDRKPSKEYMMSRVFVVCVFIIQFILLLIIKGYIATDLTFAFWDFFSRHKLLIVYLVIINFVTFAAFAVDKIAAIERRSRIRVITLLGLAFAGGSFGALAAMYVLRHKTRVDYFTVGIPLIILMQTVLLFYIMNAAWK